MDEQIEMFGAAPLTDAKAAKGRRDAAMKAVRLRQSAAWRAGYRKHARLFISRDIAVGETFLGETLRAYCLSQGLKQPTHPNAWSAMAGAVLREWLRDGVIVEDGLSHAVKLTTHAHRYVRYRVVRR